MISIFVDGGTLKKTIEKCLSVPAIGLLTRAFVFKDTGFSSSVDTRFDYLREHEEVLSLTIS